MPIAGGHTFGSTWCRGSFMYVGAEPAGAPINQRTASHTKWVSGYFRSLFKYDWMQSNSSGGAAQWVHTMESINANWGLDAVANVPDAHVQGMKHLPIMFSTDLR